MSRRTTGKTWCRETSLGHSLRLVTANSCSLLASEHMQGRPCTLSQTLRSAVEHRRALRSSCRSGARSWQERRNDWDRCCWPKSCLGPKAVLSRFACFLVMWLCLEWQKRERRTRGGYSTDVARTQKATAFFWFRHSSSNPELVFAEAFPTGMCRTPIFTVGASCFPTCFSNPG